LNLGGDGRDEFSNGGLLLGADCCAILLTASKDFHHIFSPFRSFTNLQCFDYSLGAVDVGAGWPCHWFWVQEFVLVDVLLEALLMLRKNGFGWDLWLQCKLLDTVPSGDRVDIPLLM